MTISADAATRDVPHGEGARLVAEAFEVDRPPHLRHRVMDSQDVVVTMLNVPVFVPAPLVVVSALVDASVVAGGPSLHARSL